MSKEISDIHLEKRDRSVYTQPQKDAKNYTQTLKNTAAAIVFISGAPIAYGGVNYSHDLMRERTTQLQEQGITQPTHTEYRNALKIDRTCQQKAQEEPRCDQAEKTIVAFDAHNEGFEEMIIMIGSVGWGVGALILGGSTLISKEQTTLPQQKTLPEGDPPQIVPPQKTVKEISADYTNRYLNKGPAIEPYKRWRKQTNTCPHGWDSQAKRPH